MSFSKINNHFFITISIIIIPIRGANSRDLKPKRGSGVKNQIYS